MIATKANVNFLKDPKDMMGYYAGQLRTIMLRMLMLKVSLGWPVPCILTLVKENKIAYSMIDRITEPD